MEEDYKEEAELEEEKEATTPDLVAFANSCTLHGANHIFIEDGFGVRQTLWAGAFLISLSIFLSQVAGRIFYYLEYHHITQLDELESPQMTFPAVTFCNINRIRVSHRTDLHLGGYWLGLLDKNLQPVPAVRALLRDPRWLWLGNLLNFSHYLPPLPPQEQTTRRLLDRLGHQLEEMLLSCHFQGERCGPHNFTTVSQGGKGSLGGQQLQTPREGRVVGTSRAVLVGCVHTLWEVDG
uniref:Uncharacterized protein n=1 Tax=Varanus komodoensis TaxID=61221 RepID=A0A8D2J7V3_VARKO